jgi:hypothetical protein
MTAALVRRRMWLAAVGSTALVVTAFAPAWASAKPPRTAWLCKPGMKVNPCRSSEETTVEYASGPGTIEKGRPLSKPPIDCFYVYPTVSSQPTPNANLVIEGQETQIAVDQASRFSQDCKVYAPMYPQVTIPAEFEALALGELNQSYVNIAYGPVLAAWHEYLAKYNHGRGVVLIGHSQGADLLRKLVKEEIDPSESERKLLVSALLMGGNVAVPEGERVGGDFKNIPACQAAYETHCVVAYSTFYSEPPDDTLFGENSGIDSELGGGPAEGELQVMCVNPTLLVQNGGSGGLLPYESTTKLPGFLEPYMQVPVASTPWVSEPGKYTAQCEHSGAKTWLQVTDLTPESDQREHLLETLGPTFGLHLQDVNIAEGNLVKLVRVQSATYGFEN